MTTGAIIFARFGSTRLPGKALIDIAGRPMLGRVIDRARRVSAIDRIVVATSTDPSDDIIAEFVHAEGVDIYRGDLNNVAARAVGACDAFGLDAFSRICGDRPFFDPDVEEKLIELFHERGLDLATTTGETKVPPGLTGEIVRTETLRALLSGLSAYDQEHVTSRFYDRAGEFKVESIVPPRYLTPQMTVRLVVDDATDLERARSIAANMPEGAEEMATVVSLAAQWDRQHLTTTA
jgi:spore coat polysaccharide biosynthesis protein SpsF